MRDVAVIGWGRPDEKRVSFIKLVRATLELELAEAKARFEQLLETGEPVVLPASTREAETLARACHDLGAEVRLLSGHANPGVHDLRANGELADIKSQLGQIRAGVPPREWIEALEKIRPDLRVTHAPEGYLLARMNCAAVDRYRLGTQPASDWLGELDLPPFLASYYVDFGPKSLSLESYGDAFYLPALKELWDRQAGYRWAVSPRGARRVHEEEWNDDWLVVGGAGADPFIVSRSTGQVYFAMHGAGSWEPRELFDDLEQMAATLTTVGALCASAGHDFTDEDGFVRSRWRACLEADVEAAVGSRARALDVLATLGFG
ncbi:MAG: ribosomal protein L7/L12 [Myxococcota bacterium]|nr:ribosomal protein L7/L12 [Myxococcota bacterium]